MAYAKRYDANWNYKDRVSNRAGYVILEYDSKLLVDQILYGLKGVTNLNARTHIAEMIVATIQPYVPRQSGALATKGLYVGLKEDPSHAEIDIRYRNTTKLKYVLYQYYGIVYGPNFATWDYDKAQKRGRRSANFYKMRDMNIQHTGWVSPRGEGTKHPTSKKLGEPRPSKTLNDGRTIHYNGYTNPKSHAKWLEYVRDNPEIWIPLTNDITKEIKAMFDDGWLRMRGKMPSLSVIKYLKYTRLNSPYYRRYKKAYKKFKGE